MEVAAVGVVVPAVLMALLFGGVVVGPIACCSGWPCPGWLSEEDELEDVDDADAGRDGSTGVKGLCEGLCEGLDVGLFGGAAGVALEVVGATDGRGLVAVVGVVLEGVVVLVAGVIVVAGRGLCDVVGVGLAGGLVVSPALASSCVSWVVVEAAVLGVAVALVVTGVDDAVEDAGGVVVGGEVVVDVEVAGEAGAGRRSGRM